MASESSDENTIQLDNLSLEQLDQLRQQEEGRMQALRQRYAELRQASGRISASQTAVRNLKATEAETEAFVPLSESVYIPGKIRPHGPEEKDLLVELGTGFFVEKTADGALAFLDRKKRLVDGNSDNVMEAMQSTMQNLEMLGRTMQGKMLEIRARQQGMKYRAEQERDQSTL